MHYAPAKIIPGLVNFIGLMIYARIFTQEEYGRYAYVLATLGLIQSVLFPWIRMSCSRFYQKYRKEDKEQEFENFTLYIFLLVSVCLTIIWILFLTLFDIKEELRKLYMLGLVVIISQALYEQLMALARARLLSKLFAFNMIIRALVRFTTVLLLVFLFNLNEQALFIGIILAQVIPIIVYMKKYFKFNTRYLKINKFFLKEIFQYGFPLTFSFLLVFIVSSSDRILIEYFLGAGSVGLYSIPYEFSTFTLTNVFMVFSLAFFPILVKDLEHNGITQTKKRIKQYAEVLLSFTLPCAIFMFMLAPFIAELFLGTKYSSSEAILIIKLISIASFLAGLKAYYFDYSFQLGKNTYAQIIPVIFAAASNIIANLILIPSLGVIGAVVATVISYLLGIILSIIIGNKIFPMGVPGKQTLRVVIINWILLTLLYVLPFNEINWLNFIVIILIGGLSYIALMILFNVNNARGIIFNKSTKN
jgi:O-antigen/teichoic acid export membrane protein